MEPAIPPTYLTIFEPVKMSDNVNVPGPLTTKNFFYDRVIFRFCGLHTSTQAKVVIFHHITGSRRCRFMQFYLNVSPDANPGFG